MSLESDIRSVSPSGDPATLTQKIAQAKAEGRVHPSSWVDAQGQLHVRVVLDYVSRDPEQ